jgi:hypothetical protein
MNSRKLQERCEWDGVKGEWEDSAITIRNLSDKDIATLVRETNRKNKAEGSVIRLRSIDDSTGTNW